MAKGMGYRRRGGVPLMPAPSATGREPFRAADSRPRYLLLQCSLGLPLLPREVRVGHIRSVLRQVGGVLAGVSQNIESAAFVHGVDKAVVQNRVRPYPHVVALAELLDNVLFRFGHEYARLVRLRGILGAPH